MKTTEILITFVLVATANIIGLAQVTQPSEAQNFFTADGIHLTVRVTPDKPTIMLSETTYITFAITNLSTEDLYTGVGGD